MHWFVTTIRDIPSVALMMLFYYVIFAGKVNGIIVTIIAAGLYTSGAIEGIFTRNINKVGKGQIEAGRALGMTTRQCYRYIVLPQAAKMMIPTLTDQVKIQLRITSYAGYIAQTDLIRAVFDVQNIYSDMLAPLLVASLFYLIMAKSIIRGVRVITTKLFKYD
ncbi:MAG: ABC transporter permease subunit [Alistipes sp.]|nr:ABC transporter permease subunit [Alistipes sp.]